MLTLLHSERPKLYVILVFLSAMGLMEDDHDSGTLHLLKLSSINLLSFIQFNQTLSEIISRKVYYWENQKGK